MKEIKFYIKRQYGRDDMYLIECAEAEDILKVTGKKRTLNKELPISHDEMNGLESLGLKFIQVGQPIIK